MAGPFHAQKQSRLFNLVSADVRLLIYEAVLADPDRMLHIVSYRGNRHRPCMGHWQCDDAESPLPTWQHSCYGIWTPESGGTYRRREPRSNSNLVSMLLACRVVYLEAITVLYNANVFAFKGAHGLIRFHSTLPAQNWNRLRRVNVSTVFMMPRRVSEGIYSRDNSVPPENYYAWGEACSTLATLTYLQHLTIDMTIWNYRGHNSTNPFPPEDLLSILEPLKHIKAKFFEVELNTALPEAVKTSLEPLNFSIKQCHRPYDTESFRQG
ncbi:hypothetical protein CC86DRAFT_406137 [Ophiobolus disseminans]|uniref:DUF7730 domain-containing protein n=1 Tax=Ophiobolus disseminans TaxID=1469910 RepID=A0A6A7A272_9PLEO|nr:hypothetical protein CC86DRAFT_406137 [Ophiobolus disseminans]